MSIVYAVVVTFNRKVLLQRCLAAMMMQSRKPDCVLVVDNASTDGTREMLNRDGWLEREDVECFALAENTGGAGGFAAGIDCAVRRGADWVWIMDDDAVPSHDALELVLDHALTSGNLYGSAAVCGPKLSWPMTAFRSLYNKHSIVSDVRGLPAVLDVEFIPFIGLLVSRETVESIGLPDAGYFLAADDVEYSLRARANGAKVLLVAQSQVEHPSCTSRSIHLPFLTLHVLQLVPWKRYYDTRNRLFVARKYYGVRLYFQTIPATVFKLLVVLASEPDKLLQLRAFVGGVIDGLLQRNGRRHESWGL